MIGLALLSITSAGMAQTPTEKKEEYRIKTVTVQNGEKTVIDTAFNSKEDFNRFMKDNGVDLPQIDREIKLEMAIDEDITETDTSDSKIKQVIKYQIHTDSLMEWNEDILQNGEVPKELIFKLQEIHKGNVDLQNAEELHEYFQSGDSNAEVRVIILKRHIEIKEISDKESKQAQLMLPGKSEELQMTMSPNPAINSVTLQLPQTETNTNNEATVRILDMTGKLIQENKLNVIGSELQVDLDGIATGSYIVHLQSNGQQAYRKLIIQ